MRILSKIYSVEGIELGKNDAGVAAVRVNEQWRDEEGLFENSDP